MLRVTWQDVLQHAHKCILFSFLFSWGFLVINLLLLRHSSLFFEVIAILTRLLIITIRQHIHKLSSSVSIQKAPVTWWKSRFLRSSCCSFFAQCGLLLHSSRRSIEFQSENLIMNYKYFIFLNSLSLVIIIEFGIDSLMTINTGV